MLMGKRPNERTPLGYSLGSEGHWLVVLAQLPIQMWISCRCASMARGAVSVEEAGRVHTVRSTQGWCQGSQQSGAGLKERRASHRESDSTGCARPLPQKLSN
jgi:hypothetical protein